jgi:chromosome segregation ATPase
LRAQYEELPKFTAERKQVESQLAAVVAAFKAAEKTYEEESVPLEGQLAYLRQAEVDCQSAKTQLWDTCIDPDLVNEWKEVTARFDHAAREISTLRDNAQQWRERKRWALQAAQEASCMIDQGQKIKEHQARAKDCEAQAVECDGQRKQLEKTVAELNRRQDQIREKMLEP